MLIPFLSLPLFLCSFAAPSPTAQEPDHHPATAEAFAAALDLAKVSLATAPGLEIWCEDPKQFRILEEPVLRGWDIATGLLGGLEMPEGVTLRVVVLREADSIRRYPELMRGEAEERGIPVPAPELMEGVIRAGSAIWSNPPTVFVNGTILHKDHLLTRVVHDLGALRARFAISPFGADPPEFLKEGLAGVLMRRAIKKPAALVSHGEAAVSETIEGYGVFSGIGAKYNDNSNSPGNWPGILKAGAKAMRKLDEIPPEARVDGLLRRSAASFARTDYAYAWATIEFLLDERMPYGPAAEEAASNRRWKPTKDALEENRRTVFLDALEELRLAKYVSLDLTARCELLCELLLEGYGESPAQLQASFLHWVEDVMPKK